MVKSIKVFTGDRTKNLIACIQKRATREADGKGGWVAIYDYKNYKITVYDSTVVFTKQVPNWRYFYF